MSILKLQSHNEVDTILKLKGVHKTLSKLCDHLGWSLKLTNDILYNLPEVRNSKFKFKLCSALPTPITEYLNRVIREQTTDINLHVLTRENSPEWVSQVISESAHYSSCLSFGLRMSLSQSARERLSWVKTDDDVATVYRSLWSEYVKELQGFSGYDFNLFKHAVKSGAGCNRCYLRDELTAFNDDDVRYLVLGSPYDFRNPESQGYKGRARLIRYGDYWLMDTIYGNLGASRTRVMNWLTDNGYKLLVDDKDLPKDGDIRRTPNNPDIYVNDDIFPRAVYQCKSIDYSGLLTNNSVFFDRERIVTELVKPKCKTGKVYHAFSHMLDNKDSRAYLLNSLQMINELIPGAITLDMDKRRFTLNQHVGDYEIRSISNSSLACVKYKGSRARRITIDYGLAFIIYRTVRTNGVTHKKEYMHLQSELGYTSTFFKVFTKLAKRVIDAI